MKKKINSQAMQIADYLHDWLEHYVPSIKACSPHTKRNYKISVKLYVEFLRVIKGTTPETLSAECFCMEYIMEWIIWLKENRGCSPATCNVRLSALRGFLKYLSLEIYPICLFSYKRKMFQMRKTLKERSSGSVNRLLMYCCPCLIKGVL